MSYQTNNKAGANVAEGICTTRPLLAKALEEVFHGEEARDLACSNALAGCSPSSCVSMASTSIVSKDEAAHGDKHTHGERPTSQEPNRSIIV